jgi:hypothetical protein
MTRVRILLALFFIVIIRTQAFSQNKINQTISISGYVKDSLSNKSLEYPTVVLISDSMKIVSAVAGGADGRFLFSDIVPGRYSIIASMLGYSTTKKFIAADGSERRVDAGEFLLTEGLELGEVIVTGVRPLIKAEADKITYNFDSDPQTASSTAAEILRKVPMLSIDGENEVRLNGEKSFKVLVNGRSTGVLAKNFKEAIQALPASAIKSVEVITNPPVRYDAEGITGIINIITNRRSNNGYNGSVSASVNTRGGYTGGGYISAQAGKFAISTNLFHGNIVMKRNGSYMDSENFLSEEFRKSLTAGTSDLKNRVSYLSMDASYEIDSLNLITLTGWGYLGNAINTGSSLFSAYNSAGLLTRKYDNITNTDNQFGTGSGVISWQKNFKKPEKSLTISYSADWSPMNTKVESIINPILDYEGYEQNSFNNAYGIEHAFQADYYNPITKAHFIETGVKYTLRQNFSDTKIKIYDESSNSWRDDYTRVNDLDYDQHIGSLYGGYTYKFKKLTLKGGFRAEYTLNDGISKSTSGNTYFTNKQFDVVPYLNISYMESGGHIFSFSYTQRLNRPGINYLNPYINDSNPMSISYGNPDLKSVKRDALSISYMKASLSWNLGVTLGADFTRNNIENIRRVNENGVSISTYENIGRNRNYTLNLNYSYRAGSKLNIFLNGSVVYSVISSGELNLSNSGFGYTGGGGVNLTLWKGGSFNANAFLFRSNITLQSRYPVNASTSFGFSQKFLNDKLTIALNLSEPFSKTKTYKFDSEDITYRMHARSITYQRAATLSIVWRFGKFQAVVKKARRNVNDDRLSGDKQTSSSQAAK